MEEWIHLKFLVLIKNILKWGVRESLCYHHWFITLINSECRTKSNFLLGISNSWHIPILRGLYGDHIPIYSFIIIALNANENLTVNSVQFSRSVVSYSLRPMDRSKPGLRVHHQLPEFTQTHPSSQWCPPTISSSVVPFSSCPQSFPASGSFPMSQFFAWGGQSIGVSASASVLPMNTQDWSPLGWTGWISLQSKGLSRVSCNTTVQKHQFFGVKVDFGGIYLIPVTCFSVMNSFCLHTCPFKE